MAYLFDLNPQLIHDSILLGISVFFLFLLLSYLLFNPAKKLLEDRKNKIAGDLEEAASEKEDAKQLKEQYEEKLSCIEKEAEEILSEARQKAIQLGNKIENEAKEEAARIIARANQEAEMEKKRVADEVKQEMISVAAIMAAKVVSEKIDTTIQASLVEETLKEMGDSTWQS